MSKVIRIIDKDLRKLVLKAYDNSCSICLTKESNLDLHHIVPKRDGGQDTFDNLMPVCRSCHSIIAPFRYEENQNQGPLDKELTFIAKISKMGDKRIMIIPKSIHIKIDEILNQYLKVQISNV